MGKNAISWAPPTWYASTPPHIGRHSVFRGSLENGRSNSPLLTAVFRTRPRAAFNLRLLTSHYGKLHCIILMLDHSSLSYAYMIHALSLSVSVSLLSFTVYMYVYICLYVHTHTRTHTCIHEYTCTCVCVCEYGYTYTKGYYLLYQQWLHFPGSRGLYFLGLNVAFMHFVCLNEFSPAFAWICSLRFHEVSSWWIHKPELQLSHCVCCVKKRGPSFSYWWMVEKNSPMPAHHAGMAELLLNLHRSFIMWSDLCETNGLFTA